MPVAVALALVAMGGLAAQDRPAAIARRPVAALSRSFGNAVERAAAAVVAIRPRGEAPEQRRRARSGVCVGPGVVLTSAENVAVFGVDDLIVEDAEGREHLARLRGRDLRLRLVMLSAPTLAPPSVPVAPESAHEAGALVLALGAPLRRRGAPTATCGALSAPGRFQGRADQIDAPVDESNVGGPLVDLEGRLLGVVIDVDARLGERSGVAFAVPLQIVAPVLERLLAGDELEPATLGVHIPRVGNDGAPGVEVIGATGAAARAGLQRGDRILSLAGRATPDLRSFRRAAAVLYAGQRVRLRIVRDGQERDLDLEALPPER
ncbi:MAG: S1C family serine protease [Planctomycetota bacterium]